MIGISKIFLVLLLIFLTPEAIATDVYSVTKQNLIEDLHLITENISKKLNFQINAIHVDGHDTIDQIKFDFSAHRRATIDEARALTLFTIDQVVNCLNSNDKYKIYFKENPLTYKTFSLIFDFIGPEGRYCDGSVSFMRKTYGYTGDLKDQNMLYYSAYDPFNEMRSKELYSEHYEDAKVKFSSSSLKFPFTHKTTDLEGAFDQIFKKYSTELTRERQLIRWSLGGLFSGSIEKIGIILTYFQPVAVDQARELLLFAAERMINTINKAEKLKPFLLEKPFTPQRMRVEIRFRTDQYLNFHDDSLESVVLDESKISYLKEKRIYVDSEISYLETRPIVQESYAEALQRVHAAGLNF